MTCETGREGAARTSQRAGPPSAAAGSLAGACGAQLLSQGCGRKLGAAISAAGASCRCRRPRYGRAWLTVSAVASPSPHQAPRRARQPLLPQLRGQRQPVPRGVHPRRQRGRSASRRHQLASLIHWLHTHGRHLRSLRIKKGVLLLEELPLLESCMLAVGQACTQLEQLAVQFESVAVNPGWARPLTALRRLALFSGTLLLPPSRLHTLQRCTQLALYGRQSAVGKDTQLPPDLRELLLGMQQGGELPSQVGNGLMATMASFLKSCTAAGCVFRVLAAAWTVAVALRSRLQGVAAH